ncbi:MAG: nicotinate phosphoribosyltransferase, partial [Candidatus Nanohaloarchaea archaeon]
MPDTTPGYITEDNVALFTDLYELTMMQGYHHADHIPEAVFDLFVRDLPADRGYLVAAGLEQAVDYIDNLTVTDTAIDYLAAEGFDDDFLDYLAGFEFTGDIRAVPEGTPVFPDEPLIEVEAPIIQAQLLETM